MCLCEDPGGAEGARAWLRALRSSQPSTPARCAPPPAPLLGPAPGARTRRPGKPWPSARPGKSEKAKVRRAALPSFPNFAPCGGRRPAARRVPPRLRVAERRDGAGAGAGAERARGSGESPATCAKTWRRRSAGRRWRKRRRRGKEGARGREARSEGQLFLPVSSARRAGSGRGAPPARAGCPAGMGPSSRKWVGRQEGTPVGACWFSLSPPSRG